MDIRKATIEDASAIEEIGKKYSFEIGRDYAKIVGSDDQGVLILEEDGRIAGFLSWGLNDWNNSARVINIFVLPDFRQHGFGSQLVQYLIGFIKDKKYRTILAEAPSKSFAPQLYIKNGFRKCGYNDRYYDNAGAEIAEFYTYDLKYIKEEMNVQEIHKDKRIDRFFSALGRGFYCLRQ